MDSLLDMVGDEEAGGRIHVLVAHEEVIVFEAERPVLSEGVFDAGAKRGTPAGFPRGIETHQRRQRRIRRVLVVGDGGAALRVDQSTVPSIADLAGEQAEAFNRGLVGLAGKLQAGIAALEIRPVALRFQTEHPGRRRLPAIADLSAARSAGRIVAAFVSEAVRIPVDAAGGAAAVDADVETAPVVGGLNDCRRLGIYRSG